MHDGRTLEPALPGAGVGVVRATGRLPGQGRRLSRVETRARTRASRRSERCPSGEQLKLMVGKQLEQTADIGASQADHKLEGDGPKPDLGDPLPRHGFDAWRFLGRQAKREIILDKDNVRHGMHHPMASQRSAMQRSGRRRGRAGAAESTRHLVMRETWWTLPTGQVSGDFTNMARGQNLASMLKVPGSRGPRAGVSAVVGCTPADAQYGSSAGVRPTGSAVDDAGGRATAMSVPYRRCGSGPIRYRRRPLAGRRAPPVARVRHAASRHVVPCRSGHDERGRACSGSRSRVS